MAGFAAAIAGLDAALAGFSAARPGVNAVIAAFGAAAFVELSSL
jgi:hypothetical protein